MDFQKKTWQFNDIITEGELNRIEDGIEEGITKAEEAQTAADEAKDAANTAQQTADNAQTTADAAKQTAESHASRHAAGGPDEITPESIGAETPAGVQAKADQAEQNAKGYADNNFQRFKWVQDDTGKAKPSSVSTLDDLITPGLYNLTVLNLGGLPSGIPNTEPSWIFVEVFEHLHQDGVYIIQRLTRMTSGGEMYIRYHDASGWKDWKTVYSSSTLPNPAQTNVDNNFTTNQTINASALNINSTANGHIFMKKNGEQRLSIFFNDDYNHANINIYDNQDQNVSKQLRIAPDGTFTWGGNQVWHAGNLPNPAEKDKVNHFDENQVFGGVYPIIFKARDTNYTGQRHFRFDTYQNRLRIQSLDESFTYFADVVDFMHNGDVEFYHDVTVNGSLTVDGVDLKQSVSNGKEAIRDAIADNGGTAPSGSPDQYTFQDLADAVPTVGTKIASYQSGRTQRSNTSRTIQVTINPVNTANSIVRVKGVFLEEYENDSKWSDIMSCIASFENSNTIEFRFGDTDSEIDYSYIYWEVIEFENVKSVQTGIMQPAEVNPATDAGGTNITITPVNINNCLLFYDLYSAASYNYMNNIRWKFVNNTTLNIGSYYLSYQYVRWWLVEFN